MKRFAVGLITILCSIAAMAQGFVDLTPEDIRIDSVMPYYTTSRPLTGDFRDSIYTATIEYPEFSAMSKDEIARYKRLSTDILPYLPKISSDISIERKKAYLDISFIPLVCRDGVYYKLTSFKLSIGAVKNSRRAMAATRAASTSVYADHSVLSSGKWAKIRVPKSGIYQLTSALIKKAGFSDLSKIKIYGYGGALHPEVLTPEVMTEYDDLKEVPTCTVDGMRLFHAQGPVSWDSNTSKLRTRNPYSDYGYYFITQSDDTPQSVADTAFIASFYPSGDDYHTLYEVEKFSWYHGGRNLFDSETLTYGSAKSYSLTTPGLTANGVLTVAATADSESRIQISLNDSIVGTLAINAPAAYCLAAENTIHIAVSQIKAQNTVKLTQTSGNNIHLDYISLYYDTPQPKPALSGSTFSTPEYVGAMSNQDLHADSGYDMIIIVPSNGLLTAQAQRLKTLHEEKDSMKVKIVTADELYNEFSSGTPDATAYRKYMKMLYDRASTESGMPKYLLLFGDCAWDNRMCGTDWSSYSPKDFLLCFESEDSFSETDCFVMEDYFGLLDDGEGDKLVTSDKPDIGIGRIPARTEEEAKTMVDKIIAYTNNTNAGNWQNNITFMGDDGNENLHMDDAKRMASMVESNYPGYVTRKIMWDAYTRVTSSTGNRYPEATSAIKQQMENGALMMNYVGHGAAYCLSHEMVLELADFAAFSSPKLPLWITASCDIMPFDGQADNIGETTIFNKKGGGVAFFGTTRTVYPIYNFNINNQFTRNVLGYTDGKRNTLGDAVRIAKNAMVNTGQDLTANKLQYALLGDPAMKLACPTLSTVIDSVNGIPASSVSAPTLKAGATVKIKGHIEASGSIVKSFNGTMSATVRDAEETIICKNNEGADTTFWYTDRTKTIYNGSNTVKNGEFSFDFAVPIDISYSNANGLINVYAINDDKTLTANGSFDNVLIGGSDISQNDSIGPSIYCYLNSSAFTDGGKVNHTPYFYAKLYDEDGINATGSSIGHDLELIIDGKTSTTYTLNDYYENDFGSYVSGTLGFSIPELTAGAHTLKFRAWDILNNSSTAELRFNVVDELEPNIINISCTDNPAKSSTTFIVTHDRTATQVDLRIEVFDTSGRLLWRHDEEGASSTNAYTVDWDLTTNSGSRLQAGIYIYRAQMSCEGSCKASKAKKLIIIGNN